MKSPPSGCPTSRRDCASRLLDLTSEELTGIVKRCSNDQVIRLCSNGKETKIQYAVAGSRQERSVEYVPLA